MEHRFKNEAIDWLNGGEYEFQTSIEPKWYKLVNFGDFDIAEEVRKVDEYKHLREALERGETIQIISHITGKWLDIEGKPNFHHAVDQYRIKPKTKKMVQWLICDEHGLFISGPVFYEVGTKPDLFYAEAIKPLPHTEIEVDCE